MLSIRAIERPERRLHEIWVENVEFVTLNNLGRRIVGASGVSRHDSGK